MLISVLFFFCFSFDLYCCIRIVSLASSLWTSKILWIGKKRQQKNYPTHFVNMHKTALKISLDFITLSPKRQHAIKELLYLWKIHKSCLEYGYCSVGEKNVWGAAEIKKWCSIPQIEKQKEVLTLPSASQHFSWASDSSCSSTVVNTVTPLDLTVKALHIIARGCPMPGGINSTLLSPKEVLITESASSVNLATGRVRGS